MYNSSDSDSDSDSYSDSDSEYRTDEIDDREELFRNSEKKHNNYYIGSVAYSSTRSKHMFLASSISNSSFLKYEHFQVLEYLSVTNTYFPEAVKIHIIKLQILTNDNDYFGEYSVIIKTFWLRIIQRHWKSIMKERQMIIMKQKDIKSIQYRELHGHFPIGANHSPQLRGMLNMYNNSICQKS